MNACYIQFRNEVKNVAAARKASKAEFYKLVKNNPCAGDDAVYNWRFCSAIQNIRNSRSSEARCLNIAYGLLKGHSYRKIERNPATPPNAEEVWRLICRYSFHSDRKKVGLTTLDSLKKALE